MSGGVYGTHLFGQVERVSGLFYVSSMFFHINYVPLFPQRSYVVFEGSESGKQFRGIQIPLNLKSVLAGYLRGWLAAIAIFTGCVAAASAAGFYFGVQNGGIIITLAVIAAMVGAFWFIFRTHTRWYIPVQLALLVGSMAVYHDVKVSVPNAARIPGAKPGTPEGRRHDASYILDTLLIANAAALLFSLTRLLTPASKRRALELGRLAGIPLEQVADRLGLHPSELAEWSSEEEERIRLSDPKKDTTESPS